MRRGLAPVAARCRPRRGGRRSAIRARATARPTARARRRAARLPIRASASSPPSAGRSARAGDAGRRDRAPSRRRPRASFPTGHPRGGSTSSLSDLPSVEAADELQRHLRNFLPAAVDGQRVAAARDLLDLGYAGIALLLLVGGVRDRPRDRVVLLAIENEQRPTLWVDRVDLGLRPRVEVRGRGLE